MHATQVLQKCLSSVFQPMHVYRVRVLLGAVHALLLGRRLILMELARSWPGADRIRAPLKRLDRLLGNRHLASERESIYAAMLGWLIRQPRPLLLIDWSDLHADCRWQLLRASIPLSGRAFTVFEMVFPESMKGSPRAEKQFLKRLQALIPAHVVPILVTDAGFRAPWFRTVAKLGWCYVGRLRGRTRLQVAGGNWFDNRDLHGLINRPAKRLENVQMVESNPYLVDLVLYRKPQRHRQRLSVRSRTKSREDASVSAQQRESEPWLLVVSPQLRSWQPRQLVAIYAKRMQIEQSFRDLKCDRYGCAFRFSQTRIKGRIECLLLIHALATFVAWLAALTLGVTAYIRYGGITSANRPYPHYSRLRIAWTALQRGDPHCTVNALHAAFIHPPSDFLSLLQIPTERPS